MAAHLDKDWDHVGPRVHRDVVDNQDDDSFDTAAWDEQDDHRDSLVEADSLEDKACDRRVDTELSEDIHAGDIDHAAEGREDERSAIPCQDVHQQ